MKKCEIKEKFKINDKLQEFIGYGLFDTERPEETKNNRYYLEINLNKDKEKPIIIAFMINPSKTFPEIDGKKSTIDNTIKNLIKLTCQDYSKLIVLNLFSTISSKPIGLIKSEENTNFINEFLEGRISNTENINEKKYVLLIACGHNEKKNYYKDIMKLISKYKNKFNKIFVLSLDTKKFNNYIKDKVLHPALSIINAYGGLDNIKFKEIKL